MTQFWLPIAVLCLLATVFVAWPYWKIRRNRRVTETVHNDRMAQNIAIFQDRQSELKKELDAGRIDQDEYSALELELERTLLEDSERLERARTYSAPERSGLLAGICFVVLLGASVWWYQERGALPELAQLDAMRFSAQDMAKARAAADQGDMNALVEQLYAKLKAAPDNMEGWTLLARTAMNMERYELAAEAYEHIIRSMEQQDANPAPVYGLLAQARYFGGQGRMTNTVQDAMNMALTLDENENNALGLKAIHAFQTQDYAVALENWQRILQHNPEHPARASIEAGIARARHFMGEASLKAEPQSGLESGQGAAITVSVDIAPEFKSDLNGNETVFVFARAVNGPPMPLAASRHTVGELPIELVLDDSKAMSPALTLSSTDSVNVVARVSLSGEPIAQAGDLEGSVGAVRTHNNAEISVTIDRRL